MTEISKSISDRMDEVEELMVNSMEIANPTTLHLFYPGIYKREILMNKGMLLSSRIHKTCHPFFVMTGKVAVFSENDGPEIINAPFCGVTTPGARRFLLIHDDCLWITVHAIPYVTGEENGWSEEDKMKLVKRIETDLLEDHVSSVSGKNLYIEHRKRAIEKDLNITY